MMFKDALSERIREIISAWPVQDQYAISFFIYTNECFEYDGYTNVPYFAISYNTETGCEGAGKYSEERWNYAYWPQNGTEIIDPNNPTPETAALFQWYQEIGLTNIGVEEEPYYDEEMRYVGKGPCGLAELLDVVSSIAQELQNEGFVEKKFGRKLPIIIHDLEYTWYMIKATQKANPNGEVEDFLQALREMGWIE